MEFFLVRIFPHPDWIRRDTEYLSVFSSNGVKYGPETTPYLDTFHAVLNTPLIILLAFKCMQLQGKLCKIFGNSQWYQSTNWKIEIVKAVMDSRHYMISYFMGISKSILKNVWYLRKLALCKKCPYSEFCWSVLSSIRTKYGDLQRLNLPILWEIWANMWELMDKKIHEYGHHCSIQSISCIQQKSTYYGDESTGKIHMWKMISQVNTNCLTKCSYSILLVQEKVYTSWKCSIFSIVTA